MYPVYRKDFNEWANQQLDAYADPFMDPKKDNSFAKIMVRNI